MMATGSVSHMAGMPFQDQIISRGATPLYTALPPSPLLQIDDGVCAGYVGQPAYAPAPAYAAYAPQPAYGSLDEVRTVFVTGFPPDVKERELNNLLRFVHGWLQLPCTLPLHTVACGLQHSVQ